MSRIVAISNQKGGVGKTTTAVNLSASIAVAEQRVLLIDLDPQGNASSGVGVTERQSDASLYPVLFGEATIEEVKRPTDLPYLEVVAASRDLAGVEVELVDAPDRATRLRDALRSVREHYDYIFLDSPPSLGILTINALTAADLVLVPMQAEYYALEGLSDLTGTIERVRATLNPELSIHGVLLTMFDNRNNLSNQVAAEVRKHFHVFDTVIPRNVRLAEAPSYGQPVLLYDAASRGSHGYLSLAKEILEGVALA
ncbi:MAG: AAA family ATPase [Myxococcales bacterium]|nr:AAA family ATPase [Myxococcales bacterium]